MIGLCTLAGGIAGDMGMRVMYRQNQNQHVAKDADKQSEEHLVVTAAQQLGIDIYNDTYDQARCYRGGETYSGCQLRRHYYEL